MISRPGFHGRPEVGSRLPGDEAYWTDLQRTVVEQGGDVLAKYRDGELARRAGAAGASPEGRELWTAPGWAVSALAATAAAAAVLILALPPRGGPAASDAALSDATEVAIWSRSLAPQDPLGERLVGPEPPSLHELAVGPAGEAGR